MLRSRFFVSIFRFTKIVFFLQKSSIFEPNVRIHKNVGYLINL
jgi:hypothetical protein